MAKFGSPAAGKSVSEEEIAELISNGMFCLASPINIAKAIKTHIENKGGK